MVYATSSENEFKQFSLKLIGAIDIPSVNDFRAIDYERFKATFGVTPSVCAIAYNRMVSYLRRHPARPAFDRLSPIHMLWALYFLKQYPRQRQVATILGRVSFVTFRKWTHFVILNLANMKDEVVSINRTFIRCLPFQLHINLPLYILVLLSRLFGKID